jgi:hypothetical protein
MHLARWRSVRRALPERTEILARMRKAFEDYLVLFRNVKRR